MKRDIFNFNMTVDAPAEQGVSALPGLLPLAPSHPMFYLTRLSGGTWVAHLVECPTSAQVMISRFVSSSPALGSMLTAQSLEPALDSVPPSPSPSPTRAQSLSLKKKKKK